MRICSSCRFKYQDNAERCPICDGTAYTIEPDPLQQAPAMAVWHGQEQARARAGMGQGQQGMGQGQQGMGQGQGPMSMNQNRQGMPMGQGQQGQGPMNMNQNMGQQYQGGMAPQQRPQPNQVYQPQSRPQQPQPPLQAPIPQPRQQPQPLMAPDVSGMPPKDAKKAQAKYQKSLAAEAKKNKQSAPSLQASFTQETDTLVSIKDWLIYNLLLMIPIYGIIHIFITAFSNSMSIKPSLQTYAKYQLILGVVCIALMILLTILLNTFLALSF